jgi:integrase
MPKKSKLEWGTKILRGRIWWIAYYSDGRQRFESTGSMDEKAADALLERRYIEIKTGRFIEPEFQNTLIRLMLEGLQGDYKVNKRKSCDWVELVCRVHLNPYFGLMKFGNFKPGKHIQNYRLHRQQEGAANSTINHEEALLHRAFALAEQAGDIPFVPRFPKKLKERNVRKGFFEEESFNQLLPHLPEDLRPPARFAYRTGCRRGEILALNWFQVDLLVREVRLEPDETKNDEPRIIPLNEELFQILAMQKQIRDQQWPDCDWVFFRYASGQRIKYFYDAWQTACEKAGLATEDGKAKKLFHDLRRTGVRNLVRAGVPERIAMAISGHKTRSVFDRYNIVNTKDLHWGMSKLDPSLKNEPEAVPEGSGTVPNNDKNNDSSGQARPNQEAKVN